MKITYIQPESNEEPLTVEEVKRTLQQTGPTLKNLGTGSACASKGVCSPVANQPTPSQGTVASAGTSTATTNKNEYFVINLHRDWERGYYSDTAPSIADDACRRYKIWLKRVPAGQFKLMLNPDYSREYMDYTDVCISKDFYIGIFPITQKQWQYVMGINPSFYSESGVCAPVEMVSYDDICGTNRLWPGDSSVSSESFLGRLRQLVGLDGLDLPTDAQWEYACYDGMADVDDDNIPRQDYAWLLDYNSEYRTHRVGELKPNARGLYDVFGNVAEWCADWYCDSNKVRGGKDPCGPIVQGRCVRGLGCEVSDGDLSLATRWGMSPEIRKSGLGFRLVLNNPPQ